MRCLLCDGYLHEQRSLFDFFTRDDNLCFKCRQSLKRKPVDFIFEGVEVHSLFPYCEGFKKLLLQYKELYDEKLYSCFLLQDLKRLRKKYKGYTIVLVPSCQENYARRGFDHLELIFKELKLPILKLFYKDGNYNQNNLNFDDRKKIINHIFMKNIEVPKKILLVDDVITSGSSLKACLNYLKIIKIKCIIISYNYIYNK